MDPKNHHRPEVFEPSRYLGNDLSAADYINTPKAEDRDHFTYGAGRRVCPGVHVAERSLYINIVRTLWGFKISKAVDASGKHIEPTTVMVRGFLSVPEKFAATFESRSPAHRKVIEETWAQAEKDGIVLR